MGWAWLVVAFFVSLAVCAAGIEILLWSAKKKRSLQ